MKAPRQWLPGDPVLASIPGRRGRVPCRVEAVHDGEAVVLPVDGGREAVVALRRLVPNVEPGALAERVREIGLLVEQGAHLPESAEATLAAAALALRISAAATMPRRRARHGCGGS